MGAAFAGNTIFPSLLCTHEKEASGGGLEVLNYPRLKHVFEVGHL